MPGYDWTKVLNEGAEAGLDGLSVDCCPYPPNSPERELWVSGWHCATEGAEDIAVKPEQLVRLAAA